MEKVKLSISVVKSFLAVIRTTSLKIFTIASLLLISGLMCVYSQKGTHRTNELKIEGLWHEGVCAGAELSCAEFRFYANGEFVYVPDGIAPNPLESIKGLYKVMADSSGYTLQLRVTSFTAVVGYKIDAEPPDVVRWGVFGIGPDTAKPTNFVQKNDIFHTHSIKKCKAVKEGNGSDISCPCIMIDQLPYYNRSGNKGYEKD